MIPPTSTLPRQGGGCPARRSGLRTQAIALAAWTAGATALATALYPALAAALFAFLAGLVMVVTLRTSLRRGLTAGAAAAVPFGFADRALNALAGDAGVAYDGTVYLLLGVALLLGSAVVADAAAAAIGRLPAEGTLPSDDAAWQGTDCPVLCERDPGLRQAEWELARAVEYRREVALALIGIDAPPGDVPAEARLELMRRLDELVLASVTRFDLVCEYGPHERLMVVPEESAASIGEGASQLCATATERLGHPVRMAMASFPAHGATVRALLTELEIDLATCRMHGLVAQVCGVQNQPPPEPLVVLEPDEGLIGPSAPLAPAEPAESDGRVMFA
jgi:hypothetical protein